MGLAAGGQSPSQVDVGHGSNPTNWSPVPRDNGVPSRLGAIGFQIEFVRPRISGLFVDACVVLVLYLLLHASAAPVLLLLSLLFGGGGTQFLPTKGGREISDVSLPPPPCLE